jgi:SnoaL-like domain
MLAYELRSTIENALQSYCRGIDRLDAALIAKGFHPEALLVDYGPQTNTIEAFVERIVGSLRRRFVATQHRISNITIEERNGYVLVETYVHATHVEVTQDGRRLHTFVGRYVDRFEQRNAEWKIAHRTLRMDWTSITPIDDPMTGIYVSSGRDGTPDPIWG